jgi:ClpP class serine protease
MAWSDDNPAWEAMGVEFHVMTNEGADLKGTFRDSPMTDSQREFLQEQLNEHGAAFRATVEGNRPNIDSEVFRAGWYSGEKALSLGLIDTIL